MGHSSYYSGSHCTHSSSGKPTAAWIAFNELLLTDSILQARYLLTPDTQLEPKGKVSGIQYFEDFEYMKERLMSTGPVGSAKERRVRNLLAWWDLKVFGIIIDDRGMPKTQIPASVQEADRRMELAWDDPDSDESESDDASRAAVVKGRGVVRSRGEYVEVADDDAEFQSSDIEEELELRSHPSVPLTSQPAALLSSASHLVPASVMHASADVQSQNNLRHSVPPPSTADAFMAQMAAMASAPTSRAPSAHLGSTAEPLPALQSATSSSEPVLPLPASTASSSALTSLSEALPNPVTAPEERARPRPRPRGVTPVVLTLYSDYPDTTVVAQPVPTPRRTTRVRKARQY